MHTNKIEFNTEAYRYFVKIEIGIREFLISIIRAHGINDWMKSFIGSNQRDTIIDITNRIKQYEKRNDEPLITDIYLFKIHRASSSKFIPKQNYFYHPFYYLNWPDLESLLRYKQNIELIECTLDKSKRETIINLLNSLNYLRNDIAHSRLISEEDAAIVRTAY